MTKKPVFKTFQMHPALLRQTIFNQAGTFAKAMTELVMNSIDAGATELRLIVSPTHFTVEDNGQGFATETVDDFFRTFGTPHVVGDARYGRYRIGRGQIFAWASTVWESRKVRLEVDVKAAGKNDAQLGFHQTDYDREVFDGCSISGKLYEPLQSWQVHDFARAFRNLVKYAPVAVFFNEERVSQEPEGPWYHDDEQLRIKFNEGTSGLHVYSQGIFVETLPAHRHGVSGEIHSKVGYPFDLITARNQVVDTCPLLKRALKIVKKGAGERLGHSKDMTDAQRIMVFQKAMEEGQSWCGDSPLRKLRLFRNIYGQYVSIDMIHRHQGVKKGRGFSRIVAKEDLTRSEGDASMERRVAYVLDRQWLQELAVDQRDMRWGTPGEPDSGGYWFNRVFGPHTLFQLEQPSVVKAAVSSDYESFKIKDLKAPDRKWLEVLRHVWGQIQSKLRWYVASDWSRLSLDRTDAGRLDSVKIQLGRVVGAPAEAWTNSVSYIAFNSEHLVGLPTRNKIIHAAHVMLHEATHILLKEQSDRVHAHDPATFYKLYHDLAITSWFSQVISGLVGTPNSVTGKICHKEMHALLELEKKAGAVQAGSAQKTSKLTFDELEEMLESETEKASSPEEVLDGRK